MLSEEYIMNLVREYASTPAGQNEIKRIYGIEYGGCCLTTRLLMQ